MAKNELSAKCLYDTIRDLSHACAQQLEYGATSNIVQWHAIVLACMWRGLLNHVIMLFVVVFVLYVQYAVQLHVIVRLLIPSCPWNGSDGVGTP